MYLINEAQSLNVTFLLALFAAVHTDAVFAIVVVPLTCIYTSL